MKILLLEEIGIYLESYVDFQQTELNSNVRNFFKSEVKTITAGITEVKVLSEAWDGYIYRIKAEIAVDTEDVIRKINQVLENRQASKELGRLRELLKDNQAIVGQKQAGIDTLTDIVAAEQSKIEEQNQKIKMLQTDFDAKNQTIKRLNKNLAGIRKQLQTVDSNRQQDQSEIDRIKRNIEERTQSAISTVEFYMTHQEVISVTGQPRYKEVSSRVGNFNYGKVWVVFKDGLVNCIVKSSSYVSYKKRTAYSRSAIVK